jgi:hypothetical protein
VARRLVLTLVGFEQASTRRVVVKAGSCLSVGRDASQAIRLNLVSVSRFHAQLDFRGERCVLSDVRSSGGLYVNNLRSSAQALQDGDRIQLGSATFSVAYEESDDDADDKHQEIALPPFRTPVPSGPAPSRPEPAAPPGPAPSQPEPVAPCAPDVVSEPPTLSEPVAPPPPAARPGAPSWTPLIVPGWVPEPSESGHPVAGAPPLAVRHAPQPPRPAVTVAPNTDPAGLQRVVGLGLWSGERFHHQLEVELARRGVAFAYVDAPPADLDRALLLLGDRHSESTAELFACWPALPRALLPRTFLFWAHHFHAWTLLRELDLAGAYTAGRWQLLGRAEVQARLHPDVPPTHGPTRDGQVDARFAVQGRGPRPDPAKTLAAYLVAYDAFRRGAGPGASPR